MTHYSYLVAEPEHCLLKGDQELCGNRRQKNGKCDELFMFSYFISNLYTSIQFPVMIL
jgi:hypothetical protein